MIEQDKSHKKKKRQHKQLNKLKTKLKKFQDEITQYSSSELTGEFL